LPSSSLWSTSRGKTDVRERATHNRSASREERKVRLLTRQHLIHRERKWIGAFMRPGAWSVTLNGAATVNDPATQFTQFDQANVDLVKWFDLEKERVAEKTGVMPNTLLMGRAVLRESRTNALLREQVKYTSSSNVNLTNLAELLGFEQVLSPIAIFNAAAGEVWDTARERYVPREDYRFMFGKREMLMTYVEPTAGLDSMTAGIQVAWTGLLGGGAFNTSVVRGMWEYGEWFDVLQATEPQIVAPDLGTYYTEVVAA
jgi:hypothetical protein